MRLPVFADKQNCFRGKGKRYGGLLKVPMPQTGLGKGQPLGSWDALVKSLTIAFNPISAVQEDGHQVIRKESGHMSQRKQNMRT